MKSKLPLTAAFALLLCGSSVALAQYPAGMMAPGYYPAAYGEEMGGPPGEFAEPAPGPLGYDDYGGHGQPGGYEYGGNSCCWDGNCHHCREWDLWGSAEYLMWWSRGRLVPPLVTTSPPGTPREDAGVLPPAGNGIVIYGDERLGDEHFLNGGRLTAGLWLERFHNVGWGFQFWALEGDETDFAAASTGNPILARPYFSAVTGEEAALQIAVPGELAGNLTINGSTEHLGAQTFMRIMMERSARRRYDLVLGYNFARVDDSLNFRSLTAITDPMNPAFGATFNVLDDFQTRNEFHGFLIGLGSEVQHGCWSFNTVVKGSFGTTRQEVDIFGATIRTVGGVPAALPGGLYAMPSNIGAYNRTKGSAIAELTAAMGYDVTPNLRLSLGYNFMWFSSLVFSGDAIDRVVDTTQQVIPNPAAPPQFTFRDSSYWLQGVNFGLHWDF